MSKSIIDYTEQQFIQFVEDIRKANNTESDNTLGELLEQFCEVTGHPDGTDLIYYPRTGRTIRLKGSPAP